MTPRFLSLCSFLVVFAYPTFAFQVPVQTGEHANFTRVVLLIPDEADWQVGRDESGYAVRVTGSSGFDLSRFYELIPRDRIVDVSQDRTTGTMTLTVTCDCNAQAFLDRPGVLVVDVADGPPADDSPFELTLDTVGQNAPPPGLVTTFEVPRNPLLPLLLDRTSEPEQVAGSTRSASEPVQIENMAELDDGGNSLAADLLALEQAVAGSLARALTQGLLDPELDRSASAVDSEQALLRDLVLSELPSPGLEATTSIDRNTLANPDVRPSTQSGQECVQDEFFALASWGDDRPYATQIAEARASLTGEFDRTAEEAVTELAKRFLFFGFGREAKQAFEIDGRQTRERKYLTAVGQIIDDDPVDLSLFREQASCASNVALWAALAFGTNGQDSQLNRSAVLRSFKTLPDRLQRHLAPRLSGAFLSTGDEDAAMQVMAVVQSEPDPVIEAIVAETSLKRALGAPLDSVNQLAEAATSNPRMTAEAMAEFFDQSLENNVRIREQDFLLADALRFENASQPAAEVLAISQAKAYISYGLFDAAQSLLESDLAQGDPAQIAALQNELVGAAADEMPDIPFLELVFSNLPKDLDRNTRLAVAERMLELGFPDKAREIVNQSGQFRLTNEERYVMAGAALALSDYDQVFDTLEGADTAQAQRLRAIAEDLRDTNAISSQVFQVEDKDISEWRRGEFAELLDASDPLLGTAARFALGSDNSVEDPAAPLASGRELLDRSGQSRELLIELLERFESPEGI